MKKILKNKDFYDSLKVTLGFTGHPQILFPNGEIYFKKELDKKFHPECFNENDEWPINPYTNEKLNIQ